MMVAQESIKLRTGAVPHNDYCVQYFEPAWKDRRTLMCKAALGNFRAANCKSSTIDWRTNIGENPQVAVANYHPAGQSARVTGLALADLLLPSGGIVTARPRRGSTQVDPDKLVRSGASPSDKTGATTTSD